MASATATEKGIEAFSTYAASKASVRSFARTWSNELRGHGIRVNSISPGCVDTPGLTDIFGGEEAASGQGARRSDSGDRSSRSPGEDHCGRSVPSFRPEQLRLRRQLVHRRRRETDLGGH
ncbi:SDR family oxidoreductase [Streptomyces sp. MBT62]|uniref:SDR family oxidoreductase n=1 Tax=Streptomyces sp. MBT62 TaxID=2800410 RepID=UPI0035ABBAF5